MESTAVAFSQVGGMHHNTKLISIKHLCPPDRDYVKYSSSQLLQFLVTDVFPSASLPAYDHKGAVGMHPG